MFYEMFSKQAHRYMLDDFSLTHLAGTREWLDSFWMLNFMSSLIELVRFILIFPIIHHGMEWSQASTIKVFHYQGLSLESIIIIDQLIGKIEKYLN